jgi:hypothetical protein
LDEKTGGSFRSNKVILHYQLSNGTVKGELFGEEGTAIGSSTYGQVYLLDSAERKYFVIGGVRTCTTCRASVAITIKIGTDSYQTDLIAQYDGRVSHLTLFEYNSIEKIFTYEYESPDDDDALYGGDNSKGPLRYKYKYINGGFEEIESDEPASRKE